MQKIPLLIPRMPDPQELLPWLEIIHNNKQYTNFGPLVRKLEENFASEFGVKNNNVTTVANATLGLELVLQALNLPKNSKVLVPGFTFVATATSVIRSGHIPVLADVDENTWILTPEIAEDALNRIEDIAAVVPVTTFGYPQNLKKWNEFESKTGLPVIFDAAAAYGSQWLDNCRGTLVFSLHATKCLPAGEGGLVVSTSNEIITKVKQLSNFGINLEKSSNMPVGSLASLGTNAKMSEFHAAIGLASLQSWGAIANSRKNLYFELKESIDQASNYQFRWQHWEGDLGINAPTVLCACVTNSLIRDRIEKKFKENSIGTRRWYLPKLSQMDVLTERCIVLDAPVTHMLSKQLIGFPFFIGLGKEEKNRILDIINACCK